MQSEKSAAAKETAENVAKATVKKKVGKMGAHEPIQKDIHQAEHNKQEAREHNAATKHVATDETHSGPGHLVTRTHTGSTGGFTTPDYLTGSDISGTGKIPAHDINVEYPSTGLSPASGPGNTDAIYPADIGNQAHNDHGGGPYSGFGTGGLIN